MITEVLSQEEEELDDEELERLADLHRGMVRASFGIYSTREDADALASAVADIAQNGAAYAENYDRHENGDYVHKSFKFDHTQVFSVRGAADEWLAS
jgi:hypothetical protein